MQPADDATVARSPEETPTVVVSAAAPAELQHRQLTPGTIIGGRYRIVSMLGRGGMGEVYRADDLRMGQPVALKFLSARIASERQRLYDEVRMGRQVAHPNVCRLYDVSEIDGDAFITMEFVDGEDLASLIRRIGRLSATKAVGTAREIASGLAAAHEKGVVHRDLKPANVMIDDRGRARITDFGLAVAESVSGAHTHAGTPGYMAPEQLDGKAASFSSDVYALGLVLYEVFTGRRAFATDSITQLIESQRASRYARPTTLAPDLPPEIEPVIAHCLDPDPARRPTVDQVLRELPSFDALAVAVAAGEMPGPDLVAGASDRGTLSPAIAWSLLAFIVAGIVTSAVLSGSTMLYRRAVLKSPEVLADRARELIAAVSRGPVADSSFGFIRDDSLLLFRYRQSPRAMRGRAAERLVLLDEPPMTVPGMARVDVDGVGRLLRLLVVPPSRELSPHLPAVNFERLLSAAEVHPISEVAPLWTAPVDTDEKHAWLTSSGARVEAAAYHGRPVWFSMIAPDIGAVRSMRATSMKELSNAMLIFFLIALPVAALLLARRNLRRGQVDRRSAFRLGVFVFATCGVGFAARAHHPTAFIEEWGMLSQIVVDTFFIAFMVWIAYIAIEPLVRRRWPRMLISSTRVLNGKWRDPLVGRDVLAGAAGAVLMVLIWHATALMRGASPLQIVVSPLGETQQVFYYVTFTMAEAVIRSIGAVTLIVAVRALVRNDRLTMLVAAILLAIVSLGDGSGGVIGRSIYGAVAAIIVMLLIVRFGVLAIVVGAYFVLILRGMPLTFDASAWYFGRSLTALAILFALAGIGFVLALGGRAALPRLALDD